MGLDLRKDLALVSCFVGVCCIQCEQVTFFEVVKQEQSQEVLLPTVAVGTEELSSAQALDLTC